MKYTASSCYNPSSAEIEGPKFCPYFGAILRGKKGSKHPSNPWARSLKIPVVWCHQPVIYAAKTVLNCGGIVKKWGILPLFPTLLRHFSVLDRPRSDLLEAGKPIQDASAQDAAPLFLLFGIGNRRNVSKTDPKSRAAKRRGRRVPRLWRGKARLLGKSSKSRNCDLGKCNEKSSEKCRVYSRRTGQARHFGIDCQALRLRGGLSTP